MKINCEVAVMGGPGQVAVPPCGKPAVILIVTEVEREECWGVYTGDHTDRAVFHHHNLQPVCAGHAPEEAHEARSSMSEDEFVIVNLTAEARLEAVRKEAAWGMDGVGFDGATAYRNIIAIINGDVPATEFEGGCAS